MSDDKITVKIGMLGDSEVGKTSLMVRYVDGKFDEDYIMTLGVNFLEKQLKIVNNNVNLMLFDLGGQKEFMSMLDLVCNDSHAIFFMFDLSRKATLYSVKEWYIQSRKYNKKARPFLIGTKFDLFMELPSEEQEEITTQARKYAERMKCPLIFSSAKVGINIKTLFRLVLSQIFDLKGKPIPKIQNVGEPILEY